MTVYKRGNRWVATVWTDGSRRWLGTFSTKKEARAAEEAAAPSRLVGYHGRCLLRALAPGLRAGSAIYPLELPLRPRTLPQRVRQAAPGLD